MANVHLVRKSDTCKFLCNMLGRSVWSSASCYGTISGTSVSISRVMLFPSNNMPACYLCQLLNSSLAPLMTCHSSLSALCITAEGKNLLGCRLVIGSLSSLTRTRACWQSQVLMPAEVLESCFKMCLLMSHDVLESCTKVTTSS